MEKQLFINNGKKIVDILNKLNIKPINNNKLQSESSNTEDGKGICIEFKLNDFTYSRGCYYYKQSKNKIKGDGKGVYSNMSNYTGTFLFHLQILLAILSNVSKFSLDNFTDKPARAATGIYSLLNIKKNKDYKYLKTESLESQLKISEGQMEINLTSDSYKKWKESLKNLFAINENNKPEKKHKIQQFWGKDIESKIKKFITAIDIIYKMNNKSRSSKSRSSKTRSSKTRSNKSRSSKSRSSKTRSSNQNVNVPYFLRTRTNKKRRRDTNSTLSRGNKKTRKL
jgi:hypothetical protein